MLAADLSVLSSMDTAVCFSAIFTNKSIACNANFGLQLLLEKSKSKKGHNYVKKTLRVTCPTGMGSPFDSKQVRVSNKYFH